MFGFDILNKLSARTITLVAFCLLLLSVSVSAYDFYQYFQAQQAVEEIPVAKLPTRRDPKYNIRQIIAAHIFGDSRPAPRQAPQVSETKLNLSLQGVLAATNPQMARAIIAVGSKAGKLYGVGDEIEGTNASVETISDDVVMLARAGALESLAMPKELVSAGDEDYFFIPEEYNDPAAAQAGGSGRQPRPIKAPSDTVFNRLDEQIAKEENEDN